MYLAIFVVSWLATPTPRDMLTDDNLLSITKLEVVRDIVLAVLGSNDNMNTKSVLVIGNFGVIL